MLHPGKTSGRKEASYMHLYDLSLSIQQREKISSFNHLYTQEYLLPVKSLHFNTLTTEDLVNWLNISFL